MNDRSHRLSPDEPFPTDLTTVQDTELEVLNSRRHRELDSEYLQGDPQMETETRLAEVNEELDVRDHARTDGSPGC